MAPFASLNETEQADRARAFAERGLLTVVELDALAGDAAADGLAAALDRAVAAPHPGGEVVNLDGAETTAALLTKLSRRGPAPAAASGG
ncbi:MAG: hypothetical protein JNM75_09215 [Rhodospirillales bacterium]|nr:hypothetical protein [Rhodospirillales bacterium]